MKYVYCYGILIIAIYFYMQNSSKSLIMVGKFLFIQSRCLISREFEILFVYLKDNIFFFYFDYLYSERLFLIEQNRDSG